MPSGPSEAPRLAFGIRATQHDCLHCDGMGWVRGDHPVGHPKFGQLEPCPACRGDARIKRLTQLSRLNGDLLSARLDNFMPRDNLGRVVNVARTWMQVGHGWLTLSGPPGTGKTFLLAGMANEWIKRGTAVLYTTVADLLADLQKTFNPNNDQIYSTLFAEVLAADVLLLDEAEKFHGTSWAQTQVFRLLEHRSRDVKLKTALATNVDLRPLLVDYTAVDLYADPLYPGYVESRIVGGTLVCDFWDETDFRPHLAAARRAAEPKYVQGELA